MRERPILFSGPMVAALLAGRKTVTRRMAKDVTGDTVPYWPGWKHDGDFVRPEHCPYGQPGDRLWVRETWRAWALVGAGDLWRVQYAADEAHRDLVVGDVIPTDWECPRACARGNAPGIHMPRWASRLTLEVTSVRVERLHDITEEDARAEGVERHPEPFTSGWRNYEPSPAFESVAYHAAARESFASLWRAINGIESWDSNPYVWRIEFRRVTP